jgi:hypothetical protein
METAAFPIHFLIARRQIMNAKRIFFAFALAVLAALSATVLRAQSHVEPASQGGGMQDVLENLRKEQAQRLEGSWVLTVNAVVPPGAPPLPAHTSYTSFARGI